VVGPVCETADYFARDRNLPRTKEGDYLVITGAGAYGQVLGSNYNLRPAIPEYLVDNETISTIFPGETIEQISARFSW
jgi:diaminopimelate decarboxylase